MLSRLYRNSFFLFGILFPFFNPMSIKYIPSLVPVYDVIQIWKLVATLIIIATYFFRRKVTPIIGMVVVLEAVSIFTSLLNGVFDSRVFTNALLILSMAMVTEIAIEIDFKRFFKVFFGLSFAFALANCLLCIRYPAGMEMATLYTHSRNPLYFLTIDNGMIKELIPVIMLSYFNLLFLSKRKSSVAERNAKISFVAVQLICVLTLFIIGSATAMIIYLLVTALMVVATFVIKWKISYKVILGVLTAFMLIVVVMGSELEIVSIIAGLFGREGDFTGRTLLWSLALDMIEEAPLIGYGYSSGNISVWGGYFSSHNLFLELALQGGIIYLAAFLVIIVYALSRNRKAPMRYSNTVLVAIVAYMVVGLMETGVHHNLFIFVVMACYPNLFIDDSVKKLRY